MRGLKMRRARLRKAAHIVGSGCALLGALAIGACSLEIPEVEEGEFIEARADAMSILRGLFPELSEDDLRRISAELTFEEIVSLRAELEAARSAAAEFSAELFTTAEERVEQRNEALADKNDAYPGGLSAVGSLATYDAVSGEVEVHLSGIFNGKEPQVLTQGDVSVLVDGATQPGELRCVSGDEPVDVVFLVDITGSMSNVIASVRDSLVRFVDAIEASGVVGTLSVVTFQDTVGVNVTFQEPAPDGDFERSPFFAPIPIDDAASVAELRDFVNRLEANRGADAPENLSGAIDFARNNVIGEDALGMPNVIGQGNDDPPLTKPFPSLPSARQVFVALTDVTFHGDDRDATNSSLEEPFVPRPADTILESLQQTGTVVHVSDPSWVDEALDPASEPRVDADYWAIETGGIGEDMVAGYSLVDLELVVVAEETGLLDIALDGIVSSSCSYAFSADLSASAEIEVQLDVDGSSASQFVSVVEL